MEDPYQKLGLSRGASTKEVDAAFRKLAAKYHPDKFKNASEKADAVKKFKEINRAYQNIKSGKADSPFGQQGQGFEEFDGFDGGDFRDIFSSFFGGQRWSGQRKTRQIVTININLEDTLSTLEKDITFEKKVSGNRSVKTSIRIRIPAGAKSNESYLVHNDEYGQVYVKIHLNKATMMARVKDDLYIIARPDNDGRITYKHPLAGVITVKTSSQWGERHTLPNYGFDGSGGRGALCIIVSMGPGPGEDLLKDYINKLSEAESHGGQGTFFWNGGF